MGRAEKNREMKCEKWCPYPNLNGGAWLETRIRWLKRGDVIRTFENGEVKETPTYRVNSDPFWSQKHQCWDIKMNIWQK